jgi:two-component system response regulator AtoC
MRTILIAEHDAPLCQQLVAGFREQSYEVTPACHGAEVMQQLQQQSFDLILTEFRLPGYSGLDLLQASRCSDDSAPVLMLIDPEEIARAAEALTLGAQECLIKQRPFNLEEVLIRADRALTQQCLYRTVQQLQHIKPDFCDYDAVIGRSSSLQTLLTRIRRDIATTSPVLLIGEPGTGKAWFAAAIHAHSPRRAAPFIGVNCASTSEPDLESALFGHEPGAFPGADNRRIGALEQAHLGTLFLQHVGELPPPLQPKLLQVLQERQCQRLGSSRAKRLDIRLIAAANSSLNKAVRERRFRSDLAARLNAICLEMPPLRACPQDILPLAHVFLQRYNRLLGRRVQGFDAAAQQALMAYTWPGNLHELEATVAQGVLREEGEVVHLSSLGIGTGSLSPPAGEGRLVNLPPHGIALREIEREALLQALQRANWVQKEAAARLDISPRVMHYKLKSHGITHPRWARRR